jgi:PGF-pre-PGF domain-containing protein
MENNDDITFSISNSVFNKGDILIAEYWGGDGIHNSTKVNTTPVVVQNFIPAKPNIENPLNNSYTNTNVLINWTASTDDDSDTVNYYVMFNETQACLTHDINCSYLPPSEGYYRIYVVPNDGYENGTASDAIFVYYDTTKPIISSISSSSVTSSGATLRVTTNEDATCRYSRTNKLYSSMSDTFSTTGETSHSTVLTGLSSSVTYTYYIRCQDTAGNAMSSSNSTRFTTDSSGGGGGSSLNLNYEEKILGTITAGSTKSIDFFESYLYAITGFEVKAKERITNAKIKVEIGSLPSGASRPKGGIYKYLEITPSNIDDDEIDNVIIKFKVKKSWIQSKNYGSNAVKLHRYNDGKWTELDTERTGFGSDYYYYNAESPGFSIFAITGEKASSTPAGKATGTEEEDEEKNEKSNVEDDFDESEKDKESLIPKFNPPDLSWINWSRVIIGFGVIILFVFVQAKWNILRVKVGLEPESIIAMGGKIESANQLIKDGNIEEAKKLYKNTLKIYNALPKKEKKWVYKDINTLYKRIKEKENN